MLASRSQSIIAEGVYYAPTKTPARSRARAENAVQGTVLRTVGKGKNAVVPKTPFGNASAKPNHLMVLHTQGKPGASVRQNRPLGDKTPFPNRAQDYDEPGTAVKIPKLVFVEQKATVATPEMQRPSSLRKHSRSRKSLRESFQTPVNNGRHWEVGEELESPEVQLPEPILETDDFDEIEYMPPNTLDLPYQPPVDFDLPDYKALGQAFRRQVFSAPDVDIEPPQLVMPVVEMLPESLFRLTLRDIDNDDPFHPKAPEPKPKPTTGRAKPLSTMTTSRPQARSTTQPVRARPATAASSLPPKAGLVRAASTAPSLAKRPGTSAAAPMKSRVASGSAVPRTTASVKPTTKPTAVGSRAAVPSSRSTPQVSRAASNPSTARSTPVLRGAVKGKPAAPAAPALFKEVPLEQDDFMFEV